MTDEDWSIIFNLIGTGMNEDPWGWDQMWELHGWQEEHAKQAIAKLRRLKEDLGA